MVVPLPVKRVAPLLAALITATVLGLRWIAQLGAACVVAPTSVISFVMSRKMLRGIAERAEHATPGPRPFAERAGQDYPTEWPADELRLDRQPTSQRP